MRKQHISYLRRAIGLAATIKGGSKLMELVGKMRSAKTPVYQLMRDIVCDSRFYTVIENELFWRNYSVAVISHFIDSLTSEDWEDEELRTDKKEDFLNEWLAKHILPLSLEEQKKKSLKLVSISPDEIGPSDEEDSEGMEGDVVLKDGIVDKSNNADGIDDSLPEELNLYEQDSKKNNPGMSAKSHSAEAQFLNSIDSVLFELAKRIGRSGGSSHEVSGRFQSASRSDISGVTIGNNLNSLLPSELAMLGAKSTENIFYQRYVQKRLQLFSSASKSFEHKKDKCGPIYICIDTSSSMSGEPEVAAKTLALAIAIVAQKDKRPICMINYSDDLSFFILMSLSRQRKKFLSFLSHSYDGGNDENKLFNFIFSILPTLPQYKQFANAFQGADLLIISDFCWYGISEKNMNLIKEARDGGMNLYGLGIDIRECDLDTYDQQDGVNQYEYGFTDGVKFLKNCDYRYLYNHGDIVEYFEKPRLL